MKRAALPLLVVLALVVPAMADAPSGLYAPFAKSDPLIFDQKTGLLWQRFDPLKTNTFTSYSDLTNQCVPFGAGWRPPTVKELLTLVDEEPHTEFVGGKTSQRYIDRNAFAGAPVELPYITLGDDINNLWTVDFSNGTASQVSTLGITFYLRCVHAN